MALTAKRFGEIDGEQRAAAFSYYAFSSTFPLLLLVVSIGSLIFDREKVTTEVIDFINQYLPLSPSKQNLIFETIRGVLKARTQAGVVAILLLLWSATKFLKVLIRATNRAWQVEVYNWWQLPLKSLALLGIVASAFLLGIVAPTLARLLKSWLVATVGNLNWAFDLLIFLVPLLVLFYGFSMIYRLAPKRATRFSEVWLAALGVTILFRLAETLFVLLVGNFFHFNALYGALGGIIAFLMWIYLTGIIYVAGACFCAARAEVLGQSKG